MDNTQNTGNRYDGKTEYTEKRNHILIVIGILILISIIIYLIISTVTKNKNCKEINNTLLTNAEEYVKENNLLPSIEGESVTIDLSKLKEKISIDDNVCRGTVKYTKYKDEYVTTYEITNCGYCSTKSKWKKETEKYVKNKKNIDVIPYYNYYETTTYNTKWSDWLPFEEISTEETDGVKLPLDEDELPSSPEEGIITEIEKEDKTFYSYRDKKWKWYKIANNNYSQLSSEQPAGYANKDTSTETYTEYTEWSQNYPDEKSYRYIQSKTGYRWYYIDENNEKIYWDSGNFYPEQPDEKYDKKDKETVKMYHYRDKMWKWYNGEKRSYSSYSSEQPRGYNYKDEDLTEYSKWKDWDEESNLTAENSGYREQKTNIHSRYRIKYSMTSFLKLDSYLTKDEFEEKMGKTVPELMEDKNILIDIKFKFRYK